MHARKSRRMQKKRYMNQLFRQARRRVITIAVFEEFLPMICRYREYGFVPPLKLLQGLHQTGNLFVYPVDASVIKRKNLFTILLQPSGSNIAPVPERIKKARPKGSHAR